MKGQGVRLYSYWRSSSSWRVRIALAIKGCDYELVPINLVAGGGAQHSEEYQRLNPSRQVPLLEWSEQGRLRRLSESLAICEYLDATLGEPLFVPQSAYLAACVRQAAEIINAGIQPLQNLSLLQRLGELDDNFDRMMWCRRVIERGFQALEPRLAEYADEFGGPGKQNAFCVGSEVTLADVCLVPQVYNARRFGVQVDRFANIARIAKLCAEQTAFSATHPAQQPDAPQDA